MTYFKLNIERINSSTNKFNQAKNSCLENSNYICNGLNSGVNFESSAWYDSNSSAFSLKLKKDRISLIDYLQYLQNLNNEINQFKNNVCNIVFKYTNERNLKKIKFDDSSINDLKQYLNDSIYLFNDCLNIINSTDFGSDFKYSDTIYYLKSEIKKNRNLVRELKIKIESISKDINNEIYSSRNRVSKIEKKEFDLEKMQINYKIVE